MPSSIDPSLVPLVNPGALFYTLTANPSLAVRWLEPTDPHYYDVYNRPLGDVVLRQLMVAKTIDQIGLRLSHQSSFPFLISATVNVSTSNVSLPLAWIWDMHVVLKDDYRDLRLARIIRLNGTNNPSATEYTGTMRLVFTGTEEGSVDEVGLFYADYKIDSDLSYQIIYIKPATINEFDPPLPTTESGTIAGYVVYRTLNLAENSSFFDALQPAVGSTGDVPVIYEITNTLAGGGTENDPDYSYSAVSHGTGILVSSAYNLIPPIGIDQETILTALNFPWYPDTTMNALDNTAVIIPNMLFSNFKITAPSGNRDSGVNEDNYPVFLTKIRRINTTSTQLQLFFSTYNTIIGSTSKDLMEFATITLDLDYEGGQIIEITPYRNLRDNSTSDWELFGQDFGSGVVTLSSVWDTNKDSIKAFFDTFIDISDEPADRLFMAQLSEWAIDRSARTTPTIGESQALAGSTARRSNPINPSDTNRYVTESDQGLGDEINLLEDFTENPDISNVGYTGSLLRKSVVLKVNTANDANYNYDTDILPRLIKLLGRSPAHGDEWFEGTTFKRYDGTTGVWIG
jgi:hypothetical protein